MVAKDGNKPIWQKKEGSVQVALFKNKNSQGSIYPLISIGITRYPVKFCRKIYVNPNECERIIRLLQKIPEIKQKK